MSRAACCWRRFTVLLVAPEEKTSKVELNECRCLFPFLLKPMVPFVFFYPGTENGLLHDVLFFFFPPFSLHHHHKAFLLRIPSFSKRIKSTLFKQLQSGHVIMNAIHLQTHVRDRLLRFLKLGDSEREGGMRAYTTEKGNY